MPRTYGRWYRRNYWYRARPRDAKERLKAREAYVERIKLEIQHKVDSLGRDETTKWSIRQRIWDYLEDNDLVEFPRPCHNRIPNFKGAAEAADKAATLEVFQKARTVKVNPDKPQQHARFRTLESNKTLLVPTPRLRQGLFNKILPPPDASKEILRICSTSQGVREYSKPIGLEDKVTIDLVIIGSVAVSEKGLRIGKGEGFADLEFAMMSAMEAVNENTIVITTVHDSQVTDIPEHLIEEHDLTVDFIVTPTRIIECPYRPKPPGIFWSKLDRAKLAQVPILRKLRNIERAVGKDVRVKEDLAPREPRPEQNGDAADGEKPDKGRPRRQRRFNRNRNRNSQSKDGEGNQQNGMVSGEDGEHGDGASSPEAGKPRPRRRMRNRRRPRNSEASAGDESADAKHEDDAAAHGDSPDAADKPKPRRRRPNNRRKRDSERSAGGDAETSGRESEGEAKAPKPRRRRPRRNSRSNKENEQSEGDETAGGDGNAIRQNRRRLNKLPSLYVGGIPRSVRVSEFKADVRGKEVNPISVRWQGGMGRAFLVFDNTEEAERALQALKGLSLNGKELKVEVSNRNSKLFAKDTPDENSVEQDTQVKQEVKDVNTEVSVA